MDWNFLGVAITFWDPIHAVFNIQGPELTLTIEKYRTLIGRTAVTHNIVELNFHTTRPTLISHLLGVQTTHIRAELTYSGALAHKDLTEPPQDKVSTSSRTPSSLGTATLVELTNTRAKKDHLRREVTEKDEELANQHQLQRELARAHSERTPPWRSLRIGLVEVPTHHRMIHP
ncbi:hypothetical protein CRG98_002725 [Punica granatum]|uniref:Uncharacterized protein n=1 Tax=Punica granatum TaxID=22663 RepID=A0A2I0L8A3_PUNGR|nr:hypothetical protein CRG98_002725 [Punica granatum]